MQLVGGLWALVGKNVLTGLYVKKIPLIPTVVQNANLHNLCGLMKRGN